MAADDDKKINLYYLGGLDNKSRAGRVTADGRAFALPLAGESLEVTKRVAKQLMAKHKYRLPNGDYVSAFTLDSRVAKRVKDGFSVRDAQTVASSISTVNSDALIAELNRRGVQLEVVQPTDEAPDETPEPPKTSKKARGSKDRKSQNGSEDLLGELGLSDPADQ